MRCAFERARVGRGDEDVAEGERPAYTSERSFNDQVEIDVDVELLARWFGCG
jgi:hypothetical protein